LKGELSDDQRGAGENSDLRNVGSVAIRITQSWTEEIRGLASQKKSRARQLFGFSTNIVERARRSTRFYFLEESCAFFRQFFQSGPSAFSAIDSPKFRSLISPLAFKFLTAGALRFLAFSITGNLSLVRRFG
jgi:hypothetical protein